MKKTRSKIFYLIAIAVFAALSFILFLGFYEFNISSSDITYDVTDDHKNK